MENTTIKSVCPTCCSECKVEGGTTHYYVTIKKYTDEDMIKAFKFYAYAHISQQPHSYEKLEQDYLQFINSLNKTMKTQAEIENLADEKYLQRAEAITDSTIKGYIVSATKGGYVDGYNQCKQDMADNKYTEADMLKLWNTLMVAMTSKNPIFFSDYIKSLNKQD